MKNKSPRKIWKKRSKSPPKKLSKKLNQRQQALKKFVELYPNATGYMWKNPYTDKMNRYTGEDWKFVLELKKKQL